MIGINCDLCGRVNEQLNRALIEGVELNVCSACCKFGKVIADTKSPIKNEFLKETKRKIGDDEEKVELLVEDYAELIKNKRESMGLTQKDFAKRINEKESTIHNIETGTFEPSLSLAKKLEKILGTKLIEEHKEKHEFFKRKGEEGFTFGDFINVKK